MKKVKIIASILALLIIASYFICLFVIPHQTTDFSNKILNILNTPVGIAGVSTTIGGLFIYITIKFIFVNTKFGKKELELIKADNAKIKAFANSKILECENKVVEYQNKFNDLKVECNNKVTIMLNEFEDLKNSAVSALEVIPNRKVQNIIAQYNSEYDVRKAEIIEKTIDTNNYVDEKLNELFNEFKAKMENELNEKAIDSEAEEE